MHLKEKTSRACRSMYVQMHVCKACSGQICRETFSSNIHSKRKTQDHPSLPHIHTYILYYIYISGIEKERIRWAGHIWVVSTSLVLLGYPFHPHSTKRKKASKQGSTILFDFYYYSCLIFIMLDTLLTSPPQI